MDFLQQMNLGGMIGSVVGAVVILIVTFVIAAILKAGVRRGLSRTSLNQRMNASTGKGYDLENIIASVVFYFVMIIGLSAALNQLNLNAVSAPFANMVNQVLTFVPNFVGAVALGVIGWALGTVARSSIKAALDKTSLDEKLSAEAGIQPMSQTLSDVVFWFIMLIFLPMVLGKLGLNGLLEPVTNMVGKILDFIPNAIFAIGVFALGYVIAKILRTITTNLVAGLNVQALAARAGIGDHTQLPKIAGSVVFLMVIITTLIVSLNILNVEVISRPATNMLNEIMMAIPNLIFAGLILGVSYYVIRFVASLVKEVLASTPVDALPEKLGLQAMLGDKKVSDLVSGLLVFFVMLFASIEAANRLGFSRVSDLIALFIQFGADILLGAVIMMVGFWLANTVAAVVERSEQGSKFLANVVRVLIMGLILAMGLRAMGIADSIVNLAFGLTLGSVAVAFALSFGLGGQEAAARYLRRLQDKIEAEQDAKVLENKTESDNQSSDRF